MMQSIVWATDSGPFSLTVLRQVPAVDELHHQEEQAVRFARVDGRDDIGMAKLGDSRRFAAKANHGRSVPAERRRQELERDDPRSLPVTSLQDQAHASRADLVQHDVVADQQPLGLTLANGGGLIRRELAQPDQLGGKRFDGPVRRRRTRTARTARESRLPAPSRSGSACRRTGRCRRRSTDPSRLTALSARFSRLRLESLGLGVVPGVLRKVARRGSARTPSIGSRVGDS